MQGLKSSTQTFIKTEVDFKQISLNIKKRVYKYLGTGSGRIVFDLENGYVVKVARNKKGIAQNEAEYKIALEDESGLFAKIANVSERFSLLIMEKAKRIYDISVVWKYFHVRSNRELYHLSELQDICKKYNLEIKDFGRAVNWGQIDGKIIIIDYGFTQQVRKRFYMSMASRIFYRLKG
jgi:hypothetical protein